MKKKRVGLAALLVAAALPAILSTGTANAVPAPNGTADALGVVGSDTIQDVTDAIATQWNADNTNNPAPRDTIYNVKAFFSGTKTVPSDGVASCTSLTYAQTPTGTQVQAPAGSGAGKTALANSVAAGDGCVDVARSSSGPSASDPAAFEYYAFARDAVSWASTTGANSPANVTLAQLQGIYNCTITNWQTVGGKNSAIRRYLPQAGSGTRNFFISNILGFDPTTISTSACPAVRISNENDFTSIPTADRSRAIVPYSAGQWISQLNKVVPDLHAVSRIRGIDGRNPVIYNSGLQTAKADTTVYNSPNFQGGRNVYYVLDSDSVQYPAALRTFGFNSTGPSALCAGTYNSTITKYGFATLPDSGGNSRFCRLS
jgi:phosphate transport system substrate-binding protein